MVRNSAAVFFEKSVDFLKKCKKEIKKCTQVNLYTLVYTFLKTGLKIAFSIHF